MRWIHGLLALCLCGTAVGQAVVAPRDIGPVTIEIKDSGLDPQWYNKAVFAEIFVRGYQDSNADGKGDINGVIQRLDYLKSLGISGIWLMPIFQSKIHDHGYDVINYRDIEKQYGTLADFDRLIAEAHKRGIGVIVDYVMNHSSASHPMFDSAREAKNAPYRDWYIWSDTQPEGWSTFSGDPWRQDNTGWYYGVFVDSMPDFNLRNPAVVDWHMDNLKFWLNRGVDGFRFDAVGVLFENDSIGWENQPENHALMRKVRGLLDQYGKRYMVCEGPSDPAAFGADDSCGGAFAFGLQKQIVSSVKFGKVSQDMTYLLKKFPMKNMGTMLANHDGFAGLRLIRQFNGVEQEYKMAAMTLLTLPGIPYIYYGEEIGLGMSPDQHYEDQEIRGPMSWTADPANAGFTTYRKPFRPLVDNAATHNVEAQEKDPGSLLNFYRAMIKLRNAEPALSMGDFTPLEADKEKNVFAFQRQHENDTLLVLLNYSEKPKKLRMKLAQGASSWQQLQAAAADISSDKKGVLSITLKGLQGVVLKQKKP